MPSCWGEKHLTPSQVYEALAYHVAENNMNVRLKSVGLWSLQVTATSVISLLRNILDPAAMHIRDIYLSEGVVG
jgi:distribution and morphology protein 31